MPSEWRSRRTVRTKDSPVRLLPRFYGLGFLVYVTRWPECRFPGQVDIVGASHQLWHVCVLGAAAVWYADVAAFLALLEADAPVVACVR